MCQVDKEDESQQKEQHRTDEGNVMTVDEEERLGNEEGHDHEGDPQYNLRTPESILKRCAAIFGRFHSK